VILKDFLSLFYWILFFYGNTQGGGTGIFDVSILILLDSLLLFEAFKEVHRSNMTFQSLFYWILFFYTRSKTWSGWFAKLFQSLFYWILFFYNLTDGLQEWWETLFQSLFYWILFSYIGRKLKKKYLRTVSILILLDSILL